MSSVLPTEASQLLPGVGGNGTTVKYTLNIEIFRVIAFISIILLFATGKLISTLFIFVPADESGEPVDPSTVLLLRIFGASGGTQDARDTVVYSIFGFNHLCNIVDFNPAKVVAAIMCPLFSLPMVTFCVLSHFRDLQAYKNGEITKGLLTFSRIATPICVVCFSLIHLWFVNSPQSDYGFVAHYIPYMMFQIGVGLVAIHQAHYVIQINRIPFGLPRMAAIWYARFVVGLTFLCQLLVITILAGHPILDSKNNLGQRAIFKVIANIYALVALVAPLILSSISLKNDDLSSIEFS